ncbi:MAG: hypothetical protein SP1CHLAM54_13900 [Chlamydiia bacterium]|nr:hypothetical protein [Chlamydiia bacterium]MCH9616283.1 hypothetical protein [Chlamydiia bacterium]MCH9629731.1 hypothetical protein [Chlamydiia bacterium]
MATWQIDSLTPESDTIRKKLAELDSIIGDRANLARQLELSQSTNKLLREFRGYAHCRAAQNTSDAEAISLFDAYTVLQTEYDRLQIHIDAYLAKSEEPFEDFTLEERAEIARDRRPLELEELAITLSNSGFHGWSQLYDNLISSLKFDFRGEKLSFGQIENKLSDQHRDIRAEAFTEINRVFEENATLFNLILNNIAGFRLDNNQSRDVDVLEDPLAENRMCEETLDAMWQAVDAHKGTLQKYLDRKAELLGVEKLSWFDLDAPLFSQDKSISYQNAQTSIIASFEKTNPQLAAYSRQAFDKKWIEAEDRSGKMPGGFCIDFPNKRESRIFMTYSGTQHNLFTLAHELGHGFHNHVVYDLPERSQNYRMNVAETASTMAEMIVSQEALEKAQSTDEKLSLIDSHLCRSTTYLMNIQARFLFEKSFYLERQKGLVPSSTMNTLMENAQKKAYGDSLDLYHPHFWAAKLHFYFTDSSFYNFPYTFGYLFSLGIANIITDETSYIAFLKDTGQMTVEDLAKKHLDVDLTSPDFWMGAVEYALKDVDTFIELSQNVKPLYI